MHEMIATRDAFGKALEEFGDKYDFFVLDADLSKATKTVLFKRKYPERFFNIGIAECNMIGVAAGLASCGDMVVASSFAMFSACRAFEQVRNSVCYPNLNVKIIGTHGGISIGEDGGSHQCIEDLSLMRTLTNMVVLNPCDAISSRAALEAALLMKGPVYLRFGKNPQPIIYDTESFHFDIGRANTLRNGDSITIIATGIMVAAALEAHDILANEGIRARVIDMHTIKPIDSEVVIKAARETGAIVTAEDHNIIGGLGSAVAEVLSEHMPVFLKRIGIDNKFGKSGKAEHIMSIYGLTPENICKESKELIRLKNHTAVK